MKLVFLYLLLLKATMTSFSGLASLPMIRSDFVSHYHLLTDRQLNLAVAAGRLGPGPAGNYIVSVGYQAAGIPGACAGWLAMITPAFLIIPMLRFLGKRAEHRRVKSVIRTVLLAGAGLMISAAVPLAKDALTGPVTISILATSVLLLALTRVDTLWIMLGAALAGFLAFQL